MRGGLGVAIAFLLVACGSHVESGAVSTSPSLSPSATATASPSPTSRTVAFPDLPLIVGTRGGDLYPSFANGQPFGSRLHVCDSHVRDLTAFGRQALFFCGDATSTLYLWDGASGKVSALATDVTRAAFDGLGGIVYVALGADALAAPIPKTRLVTRDLRTGATRDIDERFGVAFELRLTGEGVAVWRPKNSLSFVRSEADAGTWVWIGGTFRKFSQHRLIDGGKGRDVLESEPDGSCCRYVVWRTMAEQRVTPNSVSDERPLAMLEDGRIVAWRPERGEFDGAMVVYNAGVIERMDRGLFSSFRVVRAGDWLVGQETGPAGTLRAYRISDGAFVSVPIGEITTLAVLGPK
jgi:hypothetical protein